jgi:Dynamin GTPase effector domain
MILKIHAMRWLLMSCACTYIHYSMCYYADYNRLRVERGFVEPSVTLPPELTRGANTDAANLLLYNTQLDQENSNLRAALVKQQQRFTQIATPGTDDNLLHEARDMACYLEAYWVIASDRFIDNACNTVRSGVLHELPERLRDATTAEAMNAATVQRVMIEDAAVVEKRTELANKVQRLTKALKKLRRA